jgi:hypothetical protein
MCIKGEREKKGGKDKKEWPRITHRKKGVCGAPRNQSTSCWAELNQQPVHTKIYRVQKNSSEPQESWTTFWETGGGKKRARQASKFLFFCETKL